MSVYTFMCILYTCTKQEYISILAYFSHQEMVGEGPDLGQLLQRLQVMHLVLHSTTSMIRSIRDFLLQVCDSSSQDKVIESQILAEYQSVLFIHGISPFRHYSRIKYKNCCRYFKSWCNNRHKEIVFQFCYITLTQMSSSRKLVNFFFILLPHVYLVDQSTAQEQSWSTLLDIRQCSQNSGFLLDNSNCTLGKCYF